MRRLIGVGALGAALIAWPAAAQDARLEQRLDATTRAAVAEIVREAAARGTPTEPLIDKALEGATKGASARQIVGAVRALDGRLAESHQLLGRGSTEGEVIAGAGCLAAGVSAGVLRALREAAPGRSVAVALATISDLIARGVPAKDAAAAVLALVRQGADDARLVALRSGVERDIAVGVAPSTAVDLRLGEAVGAPGAAAPQIRPPTPPPVSRPSTSTPDLTVPAAAPHPQVLRPAHP